MGAVFAGVIRAPITSVLIIFEMTGSYGLILPLMMISNMTAFALARHFRPTPIYEALLQQDNIYLPHKGVRVSHVLEQLLVSNAMTKNPVTISATATIEETLRQLENGEFTTYPVVENGGTFVGLVTETRLRRISAEGRNEEKVMAIVTSAPTSYPNETLVRAVVKMEKAGVRQLGVVDPSDHNRLLGLLTMNDVIRSQAQAAIQVQEGLSN